MQWTHRPTVVQFSSTVHLDRTTYPLILVLTVLSSLVTASLSYHFVERPVLALKDRMPHFRSRAREAKVGAP
jgi:peptidoglycan/LPS O-acetylase OafA/YrhL